MAKKIKKLFENVPDETYILFWFAVFLRMFGIEYISNCLLFFGFFILTLFPLRKIFNGFELSIRSWAIKTFSDEYKDMVAKKTDKNKSHFIDKKIGNAK